MEYLSDPIFLIFMILLGACVFIVLRPRHLSEIWLPLMIILLFGLPRAGFSLKLIGLPLPTAHILAAVLIMEWLILRKTHSYDRARLGRFFLIYATVAGFGLALGISTGGKYSTAFLELCFYLFSMGLFFYARETFSQQRHFMTFTKMILIISVLVSCYGIAQKYTGSGFLVPYLTYNTGGGEVSRVYLDVSDHSAIRVLSSYGDPNVLASQLLVFAGIALALVLGRGVRGSLKFACVGILALNVICLIFTGSRAGLFALALIPLAIFCWKHHWGLLVVPFLAALAMMLFMPIMGDFLSQKYQGIITSQDIRIQFPKIVWQLVQIAPLGCGFGKTIIFQIDGLNWSFNIVQASTVWSGLNSFWLNIFCRLGIPGIATFILLLFMLFRYLWKNTRLIANPVAQAVTIGAAAGLIGQMFIWIVNNTYMLPGGGLNFWFTMGMLVAGCRAFALHPQPLFVTDPQQNLAIQNPLPA